VSEVRPVVTSPLEESPSGPRRSRRDGGRMARGSTRPSVRTYRDDWLSKAKSYVATPENEAVDKQRCES